VSLMVGLAGMEGCSAEAPGFAAAARQAGLANSCLAFATSSWVEKGLGM